jgi:hypothetical protein
MTLSAVRKLRDLDPVAKAWLSDVFGANAGQFDDDSEVRVEVRSGAGAVVPPPDAAVALAGIMARMETRLRQLPDADVEDALDEAMAAARPSFRR